MKNKCFIKLFYLALIILSPQVYSDELSFSFIFGQGVTSVNFDDSPVNFEAFSSGGTPKVSTSNSNVSPYSVNVSADFTKNGTYDLQNFNEDVGLPTESSSSLELTGPGNQAYNLDINLSAASLYVNGELVVGSLYLAHNNKNDSVAPNAWWLGSSLYDSNIIKYSAQSVNIHTSSSKHYCLSQLNNYSVIVDAGDCTGNVYHAGPNQNGYFTFKRGDSSVGDFEFTQTGSYNNTHFNESYPLIISDKEEHSDSIVVYANSIQQSEPDIATSFINKFNNNQSNIMKMNTTESSMPSGQDYWFEGSLKINGAVVASDLTLALDGNNNTWWIGSKSGNVKSGKMMLNGYCLDGTQSPNKVMIYNSSNKHCN